MIIYGRRVIKEYLEYSPIHIKKLFIQEGKRKGIGFSSIVQACIERGLPVKEVSKQELNDICATSKHQGIAADVREFEYTPLYSFINEDKGKKCSSLLVILDHLEDPNNLGAILRTCNFFGVDGVIIPQVRGVSITPTVIKASSGAALGVRIAKVSNLNSTVNKLKEEGFWIVGSAPGKGTPLYQLDLKGLSVAIIAGKESTGISKKLLEKCDYISYIPCKGRVDSLNVSVSTAIFIYEISKQLGKL